MVLGGVTDTSKDLSKDQRELLTESHLKKAILMVLLFSHSIHRGSQSPQRAVSPSRSPAHSPHPQNDTQQKDGIDTAKPKGGATAGGSGTGTSSGTGTGNGTVIGADGKPGPRNALLQVSEAHLAILPDEDGDT